MRKRGLTIIELLIVMVVMVVTISLMINIYNVGIKVFIAEKKKSDVRQNLYTAMNLINEKLQEARQISAATNRSITFWVDSDWDVSQDTGEIYVFSWSGTNNTPLTLSISGNSRRILEGVYNFTLTYDSAIVSSIRHVKVTLNSSQDGESLTLTNSIRPRNIY